MLCMADVHEVLGATDKSQVSHADKNVQKCADENRTNVSELTFESPSYLPIQT